MIRKYHRWTDEELEKINKYVETSKHPSSRYDLEELAKELGLPLEPVRGQVLREMQRRRKRKHDLREG